MAHRYFSDAEGAVLRLCEAFNEDMVRYASTPPPHGPGIRRVWILKYCEQAQMTAAVLRNVSQQENAMYALLWAVALVENASIRKKVQSILATSAVLL